ncbi:GNAT family N-acetyltransferase [Pseudonocardiaceae bacterium YIM PH 21723]|nr:GNAT family N-acetyltransferase [Pseudonocardiaceae bacterium YIM PH 21723]
MIIRDATAADWPGIWDCVRPTIEAGDAFTWDTDTPEESARELTFQDRAYVAEEDGEILGTASCYPNREGNGAHVASANFFVAAHAQGRGVGRALGERVIAQARADGFRMIQLNAVAETNVGAVALYRKLGFSILTTIPEAFRHPTAGYVGLHVMTLPLS